MSDQFELSARMGSVGEQSIDPNLISAIVAQAVSQVTPLLAAKSPLPQTAAGVGQWQSMYAVNVNLVLPAGGTWAWFCIGAFATATGFYIAYPTSGISAGGVTIWTNSGAQTVVALVWRIA